MAVLAYLRVSTHDQVESGAGLNAQEDACRIWCSANKTPEPTIFRDEGVSGAARLDRRPALMLALETLQRDDVLLVAKRDRLGRDPIGVAMIEASVERIGASIISAAGEGTDGNDPSQILMRRIIDAFAEYERLIISARIRSALQAKRARGERVGRIPYGFSLAADGFHIERDEDEHTIIEAVQQLRAQGRSWRQAAQALNSRQLFNRRGQPWNHVSLQRCTKKHLQA